MGEQGQAWAYLGPFYRLQWARDKNGNYPGREFYAAELDDSEKAKALTLFKRLADTGSIHNEEKFKKIEDGLWEFKPTGQVRIFGDYRAGKRFLLVSGVKKKRRRHRREDLDRAHRILKENDELEGRDEETVH